MRRYILLLVSIFVIPGCEPETINEDYRTPYTGVFKFRSVSSSILMCYDSTSACVDGWKEINIDTIVVIDKVEPYESNRINIPFTDSMVGVVLGGSIQEPIDQNIYPILSTDGQLTLPGYPIGGFNYFTGEYKGHDTIEINIQFGYGMGGYDKYEIVGIREQ